MRKLLAAEQTHIGNIHSAAASGKGVSQSEQQTYLRSAKEWYQRSLNMWEQLRVEGQLSQADQVKVDELKNAISRTAW